jgi:methylated-DNA-[protein]-cysteine S-methyltransferase
VHRLAGGIDFGDTRTHRIVNPPVPANSNTPSPGFCVFDTAIGSCGVAWGVTGIVGCQLPEANPSATRARLQQRFPRAQEAAPPPEVQRACDGIVALLRGESVLFEDVPLDMDGVPDLHRRVYAIVRTIRPGTTRTYGEIAQELGDASLARAVGQALARNGYAPIVPCHRVLAAGGQAGGFSARGGLATKLRLLTIEGAPLGGTPGLFDRDAASS